MDIKKFIKGLAPKSEVDKALGLFSKAARKIEAAIARLERDKAINNADREWVGDQYKDKIDDLVEKQERVYIEWENFDENCFKRDAALESDIDRLKRAKAQIETIIA